VNVGIGIGMMLNFAACGGGSDPSEPAATASGSGSVSSSPGEIDGLFEVEEGRSLFLRCTGEGSPTVILEGGDGDTTTSYGFAELTLAAETRTCVYDRANLGASDPAPGPRGFDDLVGDLENLLQQAEVAPPYVLVGTSGGGYITAGYAYRHAGDIAGMVFIDTGAPFRNPPPPIVQETTWNDPSNVERRDYLQVEKDGWNARQEIGDIPVSVVTVKYSPSDIEAAVFASERAGMRSNVEDQQGWFVLSPRAEQIVVHTGHAVEEEDPQLVIDIILGVVEAARQQA
jgi:pimeloyl-ACP methyl ester carboxylesterase